MYTKTPWSWTVVPTSCGICYKIGPFPWKHNKTNHACIYGDYPSEGGQVEKELEANARLIAAAPELLTALIRLRESFSDYVGPGMTLAAEAIVKATGLTLNQVLFTDDTKEFLL